MIETILHRKLDAVVESEKAIRQRWCVAVVLLVATALALACALRPEWVPLSAVAWTFLFPALVIVAMLIARAFAERGVPDVKTLARQIEATHPELRAALLTAMEQKPGADGRYSYLQERVLDDVVRHAVRNSWRDSLSAERLKRSGWLLALGFITFASTDWWMTIALNRGREQALAEKAAQVDSKKPEPQIEIKVTPGDVEVEKGSRLTVEAHFGKDTPAEATVVVTDLDGKERGRTPMRLTVDEKVFGGMIAKVEQDARYHVEFGSGKSAEHTITTFELPRLERSDVKITPPEYARQPVKEIKNTLKVTALEGSKLDFRIKVNKALAAAELYGEDKTIIPLKPGADDPTVLEAAMSPDKSQKYRLHLVDEKDRSNKQPPWVTVNLLANQLPKIEVVFPKRDVQVSAIQELPLEARVSDDLAVRKAGAVLTLAGQSKEITFQAGELEGAKKHDLKTMFSLETEKAEPRQLLSYYFWAEDQGAKGESRRAMSDMFFADVRHFEDIFREMEAPPSPPGQQQKKGQTDELVNLQKQVVNATWRLIRDTQAGRTMEAAAGDVGVVKSSQEAAMEQTKEGMEKVEDAEIKQALTEAWKSMKDALTPLGQAMEEKKKSALNQALGYEQSALEWLHRAQSREHRIMRQNSKSPSSGQQQARQQQLMNLELKQQEQRYEEEKQAGEEQSAEQKENLQVLNRLKELARRQEALAEKMKQIEDQIAKATTEEDKQELANQLQRLQEEQEQLLRDVDDLKERMETSENQTNMAEAKEGLEKTREQVMDAAEKMKQQELTQAANAATRAKRDLEQIQEDFRQKTSRKFSEEMRQMRDKAREVADAQKQISEALENQKDASAQNSAFDTSKSLEKMLGGAQAARALDQQQERVEKLMEEMKRVSEQAETSEPLLSRQLYDSLRQAHVNALGENLEETRDYARLGDRSNAQEAERKATKAVDELQKGVQKAAESVLGSETEALRMARAEIEKLIEDVKPESDKQDAREGKEGQPGDAASEGKTQQAKAEGQGQEAKPGSQQQAKEGKGEAKGGEKSDPQIAEQSGQEGQEEQGTKGSEREAKSGEGKSGKGAKGESQQQADAASEASSPDGKGTGKGKAGKSKDQGQQQAMNGQAQGQGEEREGEGQQSGQQASQASAQKSPGQGGQGGNPKSEVRNADQASASSRSNGGVGENRGGDDRRRTLMPNAGGGGGGLFFDESSETEDVNPLTGNGFEQWGDRLRNIEELLNQPELRNDAARVLDNARAMRMDYRRNNAPPQSDHIARRIISPLVELRDRVAEELAKKESGNPLAPVDRDPVPAQFRDLVRKYYTELGEGK
jgi:hypothetical protein